VRPKQVNMAEDLSSLWRNFSLSEDECRGVVLHEEVLEGIKGKGKGLPGGKGDSG
jgi:hypothetical protein